MKVYLVGGAVRDLVMNLPVKDKDYVVVGSTVEEMLSLGFQQVGVAIRQKRIDKLHQLD